MKRVVVAIDSGPEQVLGSSAVKVGPYIFLGGQMAVARESGAKIGSALWADTLGPAGSTGATYTDSIAANTGAIVDGLTAGQQHCEPDH